MRRILTGNRISHSLSTDCATLEVYYDLSDVMFITMRTRSTSRCF